MPPEKKCPALIGEEDGEVTQTMIPTKPPTASALQIEEIARKIRRENRRNILGANLAAQIEEEERETRKRHLEQIARDTANIPFKMPELIDDEEITDPFLPAPLLSPKGK